MSIASGGYSSGLFIEKPREGYKCGLCLKVLRDPKQCPKGHCFCKLCIQNHLTDGKTCPSCSIELNHENLSSYFVVGDLISCLAVKCSTTDNYPKNAVCCEWKGQLGDLHDHLENDCQFILAKCSHVGCIEICERRLLSKHQQNCQFRKVSCPHCNIPCTVVAFKNHSLTCSFRTVSCECGVTVLAGDVVAHKRDVCSLAVQICPLFAATGHCSGTCDNETGKIVRSELESHLVTPEAIAQNFLYLLNHSVGLKHELHHTKSDLTTSLNNTKTDLALTKVILTRTRLDLFVEKLANSSIGCDALRVTQNRTLASTLSGWLKIIDDTADTESAAALYQQLQMTRNPEGKRFNVRHVAVDIEHPSFNYHTNGTDENGNHKDESAEELKIFTPAVPFSDTISGNIALIRPLHDNILRDTVTFAGTLEPRALTSNYWVHTTMFRFGHGAPKQISAPNTKCYPMPYCELIKGGFVSPIDGKVRILATFVLDEEVDQGSEVVSVATAMVEEVNKKRKL